MYIILGNKNRKTTTLLKTQNNFRVSMKNSMSASTLKLCKVNRQAEPIACEAIAEPAEPTCKCDGARWRIHCGEHFLTYLKLIEIPINNSN